MSNDSVVRGVEAVIAAAGDDERLLDFVWMVMEFGHSQVAGAPVDEFLDLFNGDLGALEDAVAAVNQAWSNTSAAELAPKLVTHTDGRLVMFRPAENVVYNLLNTD